MSKTETIESTRKKQTPTTVGDGITIRLTGEQKAKFNAVLAAWDAKGIPTHGLRARIVSKGVDLGIEYYQNALDNLTAVKGV